MDRVHDGCGILCDKLVPGGEQMVVFLICGSEMAKDVGGVGLNFL